MADAIRRRMDGRHGCHRSNGNCIAALRRGRKASQTHRLVYIMLEHSVSLCGLAEVLVSRYPRLNRDWLIAGAVLHDVGKVEELGTSRRLGYTTRGQLVGHVALGLEILERHVSHVPCFPVEVKTLLQHLIVSHHGEIEKGALRPPMFPEVLALSIADLLDARLQQAWRVIDEGQQVKSGRPTCLRSSGNFIGGVRWRRSRIFESPTRSERRQRTQLRVRKR